MNNVDTSQADFLSDQAIEWLVRLNSGHALPADHDAFHAWRSQSGDHEQAAREAEQLWETIGVAGGRVQARQRNEPRGRASRRTVLGMGVAGLIGFGLVETGLVRTSMFADYSTAIGERKRITLADGSAVELNARSALSVSYSSTQRLVSLIEGQATFRVRQEITRPFTVRAGVGRSLVDRGVFDVDMRPDSVVVTTIEGHTEVFTDRAGDVKTVADANQRIRYGLDGISTAAEATDIDVETAWRRGKLIFNVRPLADVVAEIERYRRGRIVLVGSGLQQMSVTGVFDINEPGSILETIRDTLAVRVTELPLVTIIREA